VHPGLRTPCATLGFRIQRRWRWFSHTIDGKGTWQTDGRIAQDQGRCLGTRGECKGLSGSWRIVEQMTLIGRCGGRLHLCDPWVSASICVSSRYGKPRRCNGMRPRLGWRPKPVRESRASAAGSLTIYPPAGEQGCGMGYVLITFCIRGSATPSVGLLQTLCAIGTGRGRP